VIELHPGCKDYQRNHMLFVMLTIKGERERETVLCEVRAEA